MRGVRGPLMLVVARARQRPGRWAMPSLAIALTIAFGGAVAAEAVIVGDHAARAVLSGASPADRTARLTWTGPLTPAVTRQATRALAQPGLGPATNVLALNPARIGGVIIRPAAIAPLGRWLPAATTRRLGPCRPRDCPMLLAGGGRVPSSLTTAGVRIRIVGAAPLRSAVPLGYVPAFDGQSPVLVTNDIRGLDGLGGLGGIYRTHDWVAPLQVAGLHSWALSSVEQRLQQAQSALAGTQGQFELTAPFAALDAARAQASAAPTRLLLVGGGVLVSLLLFIVLSAVGLRQDQHAEINRLRFAGGRPAHAIVFVVVEAAWTCGVAIIVGYALAILLVTLLAANADEPAGAVLSHSLLNPDALLLAAGAWLTATALIAASVLIRSARVLDILAVAAASTLVVALVVGSGGAAHAWTGLLVPLCCLAAGVVLFRFTGRILRAGDRLVRRSATVTVRLALVSLARAGGPAAAAIAFMAVSTALAGFALSFRATLVRGTADQAANRVPLDALVAAGPNFVTPLELAPLERWRSLSDGAVFPVRRTQATYLGGASSVTVPMLGVPSTGVSAIHGWRTGDGSAPLSVLAKRLRPAGPFRSPGPLVPATAGWLRVDARSPGLDLSVTADLRDRQGNVRKLPLGTAGPGRRFVQARLPAGRWELEGIQLDESTGLAVTNGHQNGENPAAATQSTTRLSLGSVLALDVAGHAVMRRDLAGWRGVGAASSTPAGGGAANVVFETSGFPGVVRPAQPSDRRPLPVLADPATAAAAGPGGRIGLTVDNLPVQARIVGVVHRFPTVAAGAAGVIVADQGALSDALDAQLPGQGRTDELWIATTRPHALQAAVGHGALAQLSSSFRSKIETGLRHQPLASGVMGTLLAAGAAGAVLAVLGMLLVVGGPFRDQGIERDLEAQGIGPFALRRELRVRLAFASVLGVWPGLLIAILIDLLAVAVVGATESGAPRPPLVTIVPWLELAGLGVGMTALCLLLGWATTARAFPNHRGRPPATVAPPPRAYEPVEDLAG